VQTPPRRASVSVRGSLNTSPACDVSQRMDSRADAASVVLLEHELFVIVAERRVVWCRVLTPPNVTPAAGAAAGKSAFAYLMTHVLVRRSSWLGVVADVRRGPSVAGPVTLQGLEQLFIHAEEVRKPLAMLIGAALRSASSLSPSSAKHHASPW